MMPETGEVHLMRQATYTLSTDSGNTQALPLTGRMVSVLRVSTTRTQKTTLAQIIRHITSTMLRALIQVVMPQTTRTLSTIAITRRDLTTTNTQSELTPIPTHVPLIHRLTFPQASTQATSTATPSHVLTPLLPFATLLSPGDIPDLTIEDTARLLLTCSRQHQVTASKIASMPFLPTASTCTRASPRCLTLQLTPSWTGPGEVILSPLGMRGELARRCE